MTNKYVYSNYDSMIKLKYMWIIVDLKNKKKFKIDNVDKVNECIKNYQKNKTEILEYLYIFYIYWEGKYIAKTISTHEYSQKRS